MRNKYPGTCTHCSAHVAAGEGYFQRSYGRWLVRCMSCVVKGKVAKGKPLSDAQAVSDWADAEMGIERHWKD